jgi:chemotaxis protein methyltransferase CheR
MDGAGGARDLERFCGAITGRLGLQFEDAKLGFLGEVLQRRLDVLKQSRSAYLAALETDACAGELAALAGELTVAETYFFRNSEQFHALADVVLPERVRARAHDKALRILSAACASGEEAYTIAITAQEVMVDPSWTVSIRAVDVNPTVLEKAARGRYSTWALRETPPEARKKWFQADGREFVLDDDVRGAVEFAQRNLASDDSDLWPAETYDVVFCRNVLMYFSQDQARAIGGACCGQSVGASVLRW